MDSQQKYGDKLNRTYGFCVNTPDEGVEPREAKRSFAGLVEVRLGVWDARTTEGPGARDDGVRGALVGVTDVRAEGVRETGSRTGVAELARAGLLPDLPVRGVNGVVMHLGNAGAGTLLLTGIARVAGAQRGGRE